MKHRTRIPAARMMNMVLCILIAGASTALCGCARIEALPSEAARSTPKAQPASADSPQPEVNKIVSLSPPRPNEVQAAIARAYDGTVTANQNRFIVGDFDGDGSQDLVAVVKPIKAMLTKINSEFARWSIKDPHKAFVPELSERMEKPSIKSDQIKVYQNDVLLVVLHGDGPMGWRNPQAMNTYLLKNAVGANINQKPFKDARLAIKSKDKPISLKGDVIKETLDGEQGFLYWTGAEYAWINVKVDGRLRN